MMLSQDPQGGLFAEISAHSYKNGVLESRSIAVARETAYTLFVNDREILSIATMPSHLEELFVGFLVSEDVLRSSHEIDDCFVDHDNKLVVVTLNVPDERLDKLERKGMLTSGCAGGMVFSAGMTASDRPARRNRLKVPCSSILARMGELDTYKGIYRTTKGVHGASVATLQETVTIREDLGRHNAVDKIVGHCFLKRIATEDKLLLTTGRITSEVLTKASRAGFPIVISRSSASSMALHLASQCSIDVVSYVRPRTFNYFSYGGVELVEE